MSKTCKPKKKKKKASLHAQNACDEASWLLLMCKKIISVMNLN